MLRTTICKRALFLASLVRTRYVALSLMCLAFAFFVTYFVQAVSVPVRPATGTTVATVAMDSEDLSGVLPDSGARTFPVFVRADGNQKRVTVSQGTVAAVIAKANLELGELDIVNLPLDQKVSSGDVIVVTRRELVTLTCREIIPHDTIYAYDPALTPGVEAVEIEGQDGKRVRVVERLLVDGEVTKETVKSETVQSQPVTAKVTMGFPSRPVSDYDFEAEFDKNCEPTEYSSVLRGQKSAGYSAREGAGTAGGWKADVGHVAVNPNVIPYGSKLFIKASDNSHIYGYAIAADTGIALMDGRVAVDCFYATYAESAAHGIRTVDIFILE